MADRDTKQPTHKAFSVIKREGKEDYWLDIGVAFPHKDGCGFTVKLQPIPLDGKIVCRENAEREEPTETVTPLRPAHPDRQGDLPEAWRAGMHAELGVTPADDRDGCLEDVHWFFDRIGGHFQSYTIGNILSAQFFAAAVKTHPEIVSEMAWGQFDTLRGWLTRNIYCHGRALTPGEIVTRATGRPMILAPYLAYLRTKCSELYRTPPK